MSELQPRNLEIVAGLNSIASASELSLATDVNSACAILERQLQSFDYNLLSVKFCDLRDEKPAIRPFSAYPPSISEMAADLQGNGGCPISKEAQQRLSPFDVMSIDRSHHSDFLSNRFLQELKKLKHNHIAVVPVVFGRGLAVYTVGLHEKRFEGRVRETLINFISNITASLIGQFPDVSKMFEAKRLSSMEARSVLLCSNGHTDYEIGKVLGLSEHTICMLLKIAAEKLEAKNRSNLTSKALAMGEISNMQCTLG